MNIKHPHVLIVNQYFPPDTSATAKMTHHLSLELAEDYQVTVLCGRPSYNPYERHGFYLRRVFDMGPNLKVMRVGSTCKQRVQMRGRIINYLSFILMAALVGVRLKPDVVISMTDPPLAYLVGILVSRCARIPFIYNIQDFHPEMAVKAGIIREGFCVRIWDRLHQWALKNADVVVVPGEDMKTRAASKGADRNKIFVVRNGAYMGDTSLYSPPDPNLVQSLRAGFRFVVGYAGNLGFAGAWETLVEAVKSFNDHDIGFVFIGDGPEKQRMMKALSGCSHVKFFPFQPEDKLLSVLSVPDVHLVTLKNGLEGFVLPSKLYPILTAGKPVIAFVPEGSDVARIVEDYQCGVVVDPDEPDEFIDAVRYLMSNSDILGEFGNRAKASSVSFDVKVTFKEFKRVISHVLS